MPYEIHITAFHKDGGIRPDELKYMCKKLGVKPIILDLQNQSAESVMSDAMTSSTIYGNNGEAFDEMKRISKGFSDVGFTVVREKIEASYWHPKAPFKADGDTEMPEGCYFECHLNMKCTRERQPILSEIAKKMDCHLSRNVFKWLDDGTFTIMVTYRSHDKMYEEFEEHLNNIKSILRANDFEVEKEIVEFSIYDTKIDHDDKWLEKNNHE